MTTNDDVINVNNVALLKCHNPLSVRVVITSFENNRKVDFVFKLSFDNS